MKPPALMRELVRRYSREGDTVLDFCMGTGVTGVAALQQGRRLLGVEKDLMRFQRADALLHERRWRCVQRC